MRRIVLGIVFLASVLVAGCAEMGEAGAKMHGLKVIRADDCRPPLHTTPCKTVEATK
jgi:hypothetical protein